MEPGVELAPQRGDERALPPGQVLARTWPVMHYGRVPTVRTDRWDLRVIGPTRGNGLPLWTYDELLARRQVDVVADFHCVTGLSRTDVRWTGVRVRELLAEAPPTDAVTHALIWAEHGYCANVRLRDLLEPTTILAHTCDGVPLSPERGWPLRLVLPHLYAWKGPKWVRGIEYLLADRAGFWEQRGYHRVGEVWAEQRYAAQVEPPRVVAD